MPAIVSATAVATRMGPSIVNTVAIAMAGAGRAARVATSVAMALEESWKPFDASKAMHSSSTTTSSTSTTRFYHRWPGRGAIRKPRPDRLPLRPSTRSGRIDGRAVPVCRRRRWTSAGSR